MSRRKTVRVAQLEGRADALPDALQRLCWRMDNLLSNAPGTRGDVKTAIREVLKDMEIEALRELTKAQRAREDRA